MRAIRIACLTLVFLIAITGLAQAQYTTADTLQAVTPGLVYKEFSRTIAGGNLWRVTDPDATFVGDPLNSPSTFLPNPILPLTVDDLQGAIKVVAVIDCWGGHIGTINKRFRLNGNGWLNIPSIANTWTSPECFVQQYTVEVEVPLADLVQGTNNIEGTSGGQACFGWGWGQWGWYGILLRVYYDPNLKTPPSGAVVTPLAGGTLGENPTLEATATSTAGIARVDFIGYYDDYDVDGDGVYLDWQQSYHRFDTDNLVTLRNHMGSAFIAPYSATWNNAWIPDQAAGSVKVLARIQDLNGLWYVTGHVTGVTLDRPGVNVRSYRALNVPMNYWVRTGQTKSSDFIIPAADDLALAQSARLQVATWNGISGAAEAGQDHWTKVNGWQTPDFGLDHFYSYDVVDLPPNTLQTGLNTVQFHSASTHHGAEIMWPGPGVTVRYVDYSNVAALVVTQPDDAIAVEGSTATFAVNAGGADPITYQWQRNGVDIPGATSASYTTPPVASGEDGDLFRCAVANGLGGEVSNEATLTVLVPGVRSTAGQLVLYDFNDSSGDTIRDHAGNGTPLDLVIADTAAVSWLPGALAVNSPAFISSTVPAAKISNAVSLTNAVSVEAWLKPANLTQNGPARIVSLSADLGTRNVTLGQGVYGVASDVYDVRLRTTSTGTNGTPSLSTPTGDLTTQLTHVVFTRDVAGVTRIYIDGTERASGFAAGDFSNWDPSYLFVLANEATADRPWLGEFHLVAVYDRALPYIDVLRNFTAGPEAVSSEIHASVYPVQPLAGPVSVLAAPDASGQPLTAALIWDGTPGAPPVPVDASIAVQLLDGQGQPVAGFPADKITVTAQSGGWTQCATAPLFADGPTDAAGLTTISGILAAGGHSAGGELLQVVIDDAQLMSTTYPNGLAGLEYQVNSPDIAGDLDVNLTDLADFAAGFVGSYDYALDYTWDGVLNLTDVSALALHYGATCAPAKALASGDRSGGGQTAAVLGVAFDPKGLTNSRQVAPGERIETYLVLRGPAAARDITAFDTRLRTTDNVVIHERSIRGAGINLANGADFVVGLSAPRRADADEPLALVKLVVSVTDNQPARFWLEPSRMSAQGVPAVVADGRTLGARPASGDISKPVASLNDKDFTLANDELPGAKLALGVAPNPFNPQTEIRFSLPAGGPVDLRIFDARGKLVTVLASEVLPAGAHKVVWRGTDRSGRAAASGVYFARLKADSGELLEKMMLLK